MIPRHQRLPSFLIKKLHLNGNRWRGSLLQIRFAQTQFPVSRVAIIVPKKVDKRATVRNLARRRLAAIILAVFDKLSRSQDVVINVYQLAEATEYTKEIVKWQEYLLKA